MPLIMLCGIPSSGKTYRTKQILAYLEVKTALLQGDGTVQAGDSDDNVESRAIAAALAVPKTLFVDDGGDSLLERVLVDGSRETVGVMPLTEGTLVSVVGRDTVGTTAIETDTRSNEAASDGSQRSNPTLPDPKAVTDSNPVFQMPHRPLPDLISSPVSNSKSKPKPRFTIHHISDHELHLPRNAYTSARTEKTARATLYSAVKRALGRDAIVVLDSGNYIKGWRYQLYCEAKAMGTPSCVVHIGTALGKAKKVNEKRLKAAKDQQNRGSFVEGFNKDNGKSDPIANGVRAANTTSTSDGASETDPYELTTFDELASRFEEPNGMARWDSPLYTVPWEDMTPPLDRIWDEVIDLSSQGRNKPARGGTDLSGIISLGGSAGAASRSGSTVGGERRASGRIGGFSKGGGARVIRPHQATVLPQAAPSNALHALDRATQHVLSHISAQLQQQQHQHSGTSSSSSTSYSSVVIPPLPLSGTFKTPAIPTNTTTSSTIKATIATEREAEAEAEDEDEGQDSAIDSVDSNTLIIHLPIATPLPTFAQLQRMRRQFISLQRQRMGGLGVLVGGNGSSTGSRTVEALFVDWLNDAFEHGGGGGGGV